MRIDGGAHQLLCFSQFARRCGFPRFDDRCQTFPDLSGFLALADGLPVSGFQCRCGCVRVVHIDIAEQAIVTLFGTIMVLVEPVDKGADGGG